MEDKLKKIKLIVSDVDGVLTDGLIRLDADGRELKFFQGRDAFRIQIWRKSGRPMLWFTGRKTPAVITRAKEMNVDLVFKANIGGDLFAHVKKTYGLAPEEILYVGDDWNDLYYMDNAGVSVTPANASAENLKIAQIITKAKGGEGVLAEVVESVLRAQGDWNKLVQPFHQKFIL